MYVSLFIKVNSLHLTKKNFYRLLTHGRDKKYFHLESDCESQNMYGNLCSLDKTHSGTIYSIWWRSRFRVGVSIIPVRSSMLHYGIVLNISIKISPTVSVHKLKCKLERFLYQSIQFFCAASPGTESMAGDGRKISEHRFDFGLRHHGTWASGRATEEGSFFRDGQTCNWCILEVYWGL